MRGGWGSPNFFAMKFQIFSQIQKNSEKKSAKILKSSQNFCHISIHGSSK